MKKVISLALCLMMLLSFMVISTNAAIPAHYPKTVDIFTRNFDGGADESTSSQLKTVDSAVGGTGGVIDVDGNNVMEFKLDGTEYTSARSVVANAHEGGFLSTVSGVGSKYTFTFDLYPVCNTTGFSFFFSNIEGVHIYPSALVEGMWNTVKVDVDNGVKNYYVKMTDMDDSTYTKLVPGTTCHKTSGLGSAATFYMGIRTDFMNLEDSSVDMTNLTNAHYYLDNAVITKYYPNQRNVVYTNTVDSITSVGGAITDLKLTGINHSDLQNYFSVTFDAVRTGGDQPISFVLGAKGTSKSSSFHIINTGVQGVKYTYKFNVNQGASSWQMPPASAWRKAEGETQWTELVAGTDFYNISHQNGNSDFFRLAYYAGSDKYPGNTTVDANTVWTVDNIQVTNSLDVAITGAFEQTETGIVGELGITKPNGNYTAIVAFYDGTVFKGAAAADISVEGTVDVNLETDSSAETLTAKIFLWDSMGTLVPIRDTMNVSDWVK